MQFLSLETFIVLLQAHLPVLYKIKIFACYKWKRVLTVVSFLWTLTTHSNIVFCSCFGLLLKRNLHKLKCCADFLEFYQKFVYCSSVFCLNKFISNIFVWNQVICAASSSYTPGVILVWWDFSLEVLLIIKKKLFSTTTIFQLAIWVK